jgi:acyl carrier protein
MLGQRRLKFRRLGRLLKTIKPSVEEVITVIIEFLAELEERSAQEVRSELEAAGTDLPVDSILIVEILTRVEEHYGIAIPADAQAARATRSVGAFADAVLDAITERQQS